MTRKGSIKSFFFKLDLLRHFACPMCHFFAVVDFVQTRILLWSSQRTLLFFTNTVSLFSSASLARKKWRASRVELFFSSLTSDRSSICQLSSDNEQRRRQGKKKKSLHQGFGHRTEQFWGRLINFSQSLLGVGRGHKMWMWAKKPSLEQIQRFLPYPGCVWHQKRFFKAYSSH